MVRGLDRLGQARIMEAIAATVIILVLAALMPMLFKSPTTQLQSQVESNLETYAQTVLAELINNPHFLTILEHCLSTGNCEALQSLMNTLVGPQYDWYVAVVPYGKLVTSTSIVGGGEYVLLPITVVVNWKTAPPIQVPYPTTDPRISELTLNVYLLNELLTAFGYKYQINTALPLSNVAFIQCANQSITNITECIESGQAVMLRWWLTYFDGRTGTAVVWVNATGNIYMEVSSNSSLPYDVLTNSYCSEPYCYDKGLGGFSYLMLNTYKEPYALTPSFTDVNYTTSKSLSCTGDVYSSNNYLVKLKTNGLTQPPYSLPPSTASCTARLKLPSEPFNYSVYAIGQLITAIPGSTVTYSVVVNATPYALKLTQSGPQVIPEKQYTQHITVLTKLTYYGNGTEVVTTNITTSTGSRSNSTRLPQYYYLYLLSMDIGLNGICKTSSKPVNLTVSTTIYDFPTTLSNETSTTYPLPCDLVKNQIGYNITITEINVTQSSPNPQCSSGYCNYYVYNTTSIIYDMWVSGTPTTTYYLPVYVSYSFDKLNAMNEVPWQYRERFGLGGFSPTASAFAVVQLNGTYYLVYVGISSLAGG